MKISIITATYNAENTLAACLRSLAAQTHPDIEQWIIDGASTDRTLAIADSHKSRVAGIVSENDSGIYDALNKGIRRATGEVIGFLHADDVYANERVLETVAAAFDEPTVEAVYGDLTYVDRSDMRRIVRYWKAGSFDRRLISGGWMPPHPTLYVRRSVYERLGAFNTEYRISADYDCVVRFLFVAEVKTVYVPNVLICMRVGGISNRSIRTIIQKSLEDLRIARSHRIGGLVLVFKKNFRKLHQFWRR